MDPEKIRRDFFRRIGDFQPFQQLFDLLPDVCFFVKDRQSRFIMHNLRGVECCGTASEEELVGKLGYEYIVHNLMSLYIEQDRQVMETGQPIINAICPSPEKGKESLIIFSKVPLRDRRGRVIGLAGIWRDISNLDAPTVKLGRIGRAVQTIHRRYAESLLVRDLAAEAGLSRSQFERQFVHLFGTTPREYLVRVRVYAACRLLVETDDNVTQIAMQTGFYDHSHFCRTFRRIMGISPGLFRRRHASQALYVRHRAP